MDATKFTQSLQDEFEKFTAEVKKPNILLVGATGVGKSSLINHCFGEALASVGVGLPVTQCIDSFSCESVPVVLFDTKGYEVGSKQERDFLEDVVSYAAKSRENDNPIHLAWYCLQAPSARIVDFDVDVINRLRASQIPVAIVLTKAELVSEEDAAEFQKVITSLLPDVPIFETSTRDTQRAWEFGELCRWSTDKLPEALKIGFVAAQKRNLEIKYAEAAKVIKQHAATAAGVGFIPIPFSDAPILVANQFAMIARILFIYNLESASSLLDKSVVASMIGPAISGSGIWMAGQLLKFLGPLGAAVGGVISATVAAGITYAIGAATSALCEKLYVAGINGNVDALNGIVKNSAAYFEEQFKKYLRLSQESK